MYRNNIFYYYFLQFIFNISISKRSKNTQKINLKQNKKFKFKKKTHFDNKNKH